MLSVLVAAQTPRVWQPAEKPIIQITAAKTFDLKTKNTFPDRLTAKEKHAMV